MEESGFFIRGGRTSDGFVVSMRVGTRRGSALIPIFATNLEKFHRSVGLSVRIITTNQLTEGTQLATWRFI
jgi:hypothetical protein